MNCNEELEQTNIHVQYGLTTKIYHLKVAALVDKYTKKGGNVLDIGAGAGNILVNLHELRPDLVLASADAYQGSLDVTKVRVPLSNQWLLPEGEMNLSGIGEKFDTCVLSHVLEHVWNPVDAVNQAFGCLKDGGRLVLAVPNPVNPVNFIRTAIQHYSVNAGHCFHWDRGHWVNFLENIVKANVLEYDHDEIFLFKRKTSHDSYLKKIEIACSTIFPGLSFSHLAVIERPIIESKSI